MLLYYDYIRLVLCLVIVSCSPCPCNSEVHSQNEAIALKYLESLTFSKSCCCSFYALEQLECFLGRKPYYNLCYICYLCSNNCNCFVFSEYYYKYI